MAQIRIEKTRVRHRRGLHDLLDDLIITVICPTCQTLEKYGPPNFGNRNHHCNLGSRDEKAAAGGPLRPV
jgi:hypothetical protein